MPVMNHTKIRKFKAF